MKIARLQSRTKRKAFIQGLKNFSIGRRQFFALENFLSKWLFVDRCPMRTRAYA